MGEGNEKNYYSVYVGNFAFAFNVFLLFASGFCCLYCCGCLYALSVGDLGDLGGGSPTTFFAFDTRVDYKDLGLFRQCYLGTAPPEAMYLGDLGGGNPTEFGHFDGVVNYKDAALFNKCYTADKTVDLPIAYSTEFWFTVPSAVSNDTGKEVWYYVLARVYVPSNLSQQNFFFIADASERVQNVKMDSSLKAGSGGSVNIDLGSLYWGYHYLGFEFVDISGSGSLNFHIATASGQYAWLVRFRICVPNYSQQEIRYNVTTTTWLPGSDYYFLKGFADDYIDDVRLGVGELYNDWQWDMGNYGKIYNWSDGFRYPLGYLDPGAWRNVKFTFGDIWGAGLLDFQYLSYSNQKERIGLPEFYAWCKANVTDPGHLFYLGDDPTQVYPYGNTHTVGRKYSVGSRWNETLKPGISKRFISTSQELCLLDDEAGRDTYTRLQLGFGVGWLEPKFSETTQFGIMINLTRGGLDGHGDTFTWVRLENVKLDVYTPTQSVSIAGLVFRDPQNPSDNIVNLGGTIAVSATAGIASWLVSEAAGAELIGPAGIIVAIIGIAAGKEIYNYVAGHQQESFGISPGGNSTYRQIWYSYMLQIWNPEESMSHIVFVGLGKASPESCGAIKLVLRGEINLTKNFGLSFQRVITTFELGIIIPIFAW